MDPLPARGRDLALVSLNSLNSLSSAWTVFRRDRIHRIVFSDVGQARQGRTRRALVVGGKEAVLISLELDNSGAADLRVLQRFHLDDCAGDGAFLDDDLVLLSTLHNTVHVYPLSPSAPSSSASSDSPPTRPIYTLHALSRPTLWCTRFDRAHYRSSADGRDGIRLAGGSLWGDTFLWAVGAAQALAKMARRAAKGADRAPAASQTAPEETLRRLAGHKGAVFTASFSPCTRFLVTGSDDRTLRVWDLALPVAIAAAEEYPYLVLWGHTARVWRRVFLPSPIPSHDARPNDDLRIASVAEDGTARIWLVSPGPGAPPPSTEQGYTCIATFRDGHDGRSLWAVAAVVRLEGDVVMLTGGADGAVRSWGVSGQGGKVPGGGRAARAGARKGRKVKAFVAAAVEVDGAEGRDDLVVVALEDGIFAAHATQPAPPLVETKPFYTSPSWAGSASACTLRLVPSSSPNTPHAFTLLAFSARGGVLRASLSASGELLDSVVEFRIDFRPALVHLGAVDGAGQLRIAVWDRANLRVVLLNLDMTGASKPPAIVASLSLSRTSPAPTGLHLLTDSLLLLGTAAGSLALYRLSNSLGTLELLSRAERIHTNGIADISARPAPGGGWTVTTVGKDGARCLVDVVVDETSARVVRRDCRVLGKGSLEEIVTSGAGEMYLGLFESRAVLLDQLGQQLHSFDSPAKRVPHQLVRARDGSIRYYRIVSGEMESQSLPPAAALPPPILRRGLHGREIRAVEAVRTADGSELVATAAENGVLSVSKLRTDDSLEPLYTTRNLPAAVKALAWSPLSSAASTSADAYLLFACGARELLLAYSVRSSPMGDGGIDVLPAGQLLAAEGGEVRAMDLAVVPLDGALREGHAVVVGYSDGSLRIWHHDAAASTFSLVARSEEPSKCLLTVEIIEVELGADEKRWVVVTGASDGLLAMRDLKSFVRGRSLAGTALPPPFFAMHLHQSGINALSLRLSNSGLLVATGGDDNAVSVASLALSLSQAAGESNQQLAAHLEARAVLANAHASTIQGLDWLTPAVLASSSVEQRLNLYDFSLSHSLTAPSLELALRESTVLDVADCSAQAVLPYRAEAEEDGCHGWKVVVAGIGVVVVDVRAVR